MRRTVAKADEPAVSARRVRVAHVKRGVTTLAPHMRPLRAMVLAVAVTMVAPGVAAGRLPGTPVPRGFVGMNIDGPMLNAQDGVTLPSQFGLMRSRGVQNIRAVFSWS